MIVPTPRLWTAGDEPDADMMNERASAMIEFLLEPPQAMVRATVVQSIPNNSWTKFNFDTVDKDNDGIVDVANSKFVIQTPGWYEVVLGVSYSGGTAGKRCAAVRLNGITANGGLRGRRDTLPDNTTSRTCRTGGSLHAMFLNQNDYIELFGWQSAGSALNTYVAEVNAQPLLQVRWVSN